MIAPKNVAVIAAFMMEGMRDLETRPENKISYNELIEAWGLGCFEMVSVMVSYADYVEDQFEKALKDGKEVMGVFDYEVSVPFGFWFGEFVYQNKSAPGEDQAHQKIDELIGEFFSD